MKRFTRTLLPIAAISALTVITPLHAVFQVSLPGTTERGIWEDLNATNYPVTDGFNNFGTNTAGWTNSIAATGGSSATFDKVAGTGGYPASASIYNFVVPGSFFIVDLDPMPGIDIVVFQTDMGGFMQVPPTLSVNGGTGLAPSLTATKPGNFVASGPSAGSPTEVFAYEWDLSSAGPVNQYQISWTSGVHSSNSFMQVDTGDTYASAIPEPASFPLLGALIAGLVAIGRRKPRKLRCG